MVTTDQFADRNFARCHDAIKRGRHRGVAKCDLRVLGIGLRLQHIGPRGIAVGACLVEVGLCRDVLGLELLLPGEFGFGIDERRLGALLRRLRLLQLDLVGLGLDHEQRRALLHGLAVLIFYLLHVSLHAGHELDVVDRGCIAGGLQIRRDRLLYRQLHGHLRWRRRDEAILLAARRQGDRRRTRDHGQGCVAAGLRP